MSKPLLSLDIETECAVQSCKYYKKSLCEEGHSLSPWHNRITVIGVTDGENISFVTRTLHGLRVFLDSLDDYLLVGHNFKFDLLNLLVHGVEIPLEKWAHCTQLMAYVSTSKIPDWWLEEYESVRKTLKDGHRKAAKHSLKTLAPYFLGVDPFWEVADHDDDEYVLKDAVYTLNLFRHFSATLKEAGEWDFYINKQLPWAKMLLKAELRGLKIDLEALNNMEADLSKKAVDLKLQLDSQWKDAHEAYATNRKVECYLKYDQMARNQKKTFETSPKHQKLCEAALTKTETEINYDSPTQMLWLLRDHLGYNCTSLEEGEGTGREILERLADEGKEDVRKFLEWRKVNKVLSSFLPSYKEMQVDGVIHPIYSNSSTRTGRTSSERINLQQVPPELRRLFVAREGYTFVGLDSGAIEAKIIAFYSQDPVLYNIIDSGASIHNFHTKIFFGLEEASLEDIPKKYPIQRQATKNIGFGLYYNAGARRIQITFAQKGFIFTYDQCKAILKRFHSAYSVAMEFSKNIVNFFEAGGVMTNLLGRPVAIENPDDAYMKGFNKLVQGSASDVILDAAYRTQNEYDKLGLDAHVVTFVHDFVLVEVIDKDAKLAERILTEKMTDCKLETPNGDIKLTVEGGIMKQWEK